MQAVILAAGKGIRLRPLTFNMPKPLLKIAGRPILEYTFDALPDKVEEIVLVVGYLGDQIKKYFGKNYNGRKITYIYQKQQLGTFNALKQARPVLGLDFLVLMGDDLYSRRDLSKLLKSENSVLVQKVKGPSEKFGVCTIKGRCWLKDIFEKQPGIKFTFANCGAFKLNRDIFKEKIIYGPGRGEGEREEWLSSMVGSLAKKKKVKVVRTTKWFPIATVQDLKKVEECLIKDR